MLGRTIIKKDDKISVTPPQELNCKSIIETSSSEAELNTDRASIDILSLNRRQLQKECKNQELKATGINAVLCERLQKHWAK